MLFLGIVYIIDSYFKLCLMMGFKAFYSAEATLVGIELYRMLKKGQHINSKSATAFEQFCIGSIAAPRKSLYIDFSVSLKYLRRNR
jgi:hypothetical protein